MRHGQLGEASASLEARLWLAERPEAAACLRLALVDKVGALEVLDDALRAEQAAGDAMTLRCDLLTVTAQELECLGYTVFDMGLLSIRDTDPHDFDLADLRVADRVGTCLFIIESQMNQVALVQPFGSRVEGPASDRMQYNIGIARSLPVQEQIAISVPLNDSWFPWMGLAVTPAQAPSQGNVHATAIYIRRVCK